MAVLHLDVCLSGTLSRSIFPKLYLYHTLRLLFHSGEAHERVRVRPANPKDFPDIMTMIKELSDYQKMPPDFDIDAASKCICTLVIQLAQGLHPHTEQYLGRG